VGEVLWGFAGWGWRSTSASSSAALKAELRAWWQFGSAGGAMRCEGGTALYAKFRAFRIGAAAFRAIHYQGLSAFGMRIR